jgi:Sulfotransferase family
MPPERNSRPVSVAFQPLTSLLGYAPIDELRSGRATLEELHRVLQLRLEHYVEVDQPLVLISQLGRCGGTLLSQLFDGHPQCHAHPHELHIGHPRKEAWPQLDPTADADELFAILRETRGERRFWQGYDKAARKFVSYDGESRETHPFMLVPSLQRRLFHLLVSEVYEVSSERDVLDCYMTSYFNAWLDYQLLYAGTQRWITGFVPQLAWGEGRERFFTAYPDGRLIVCLRDPLSWYASAKAYNPVRFGEVAEADGLWVRGAEEIVAAKREGGDAVFVVGFEDLLLDPERTMRSIAGYLEIDFSPALCAPTFNGRPIQAGSSFPVTRHGVLTEPLERHRDVLTPQEIEHLESRTSALYEEARSLKDSPAPRRSRASVQG